MERQSVPLQDPGQSGGLQKPSSRRHCGPSLFGALSGIAATKATLTSLRIKTRFRRRCTLKVVGKTRLTDFVVEVADHLKQATNAIF
jgi:hypothetical protein